jgi:hypothetical protein
MYSNEAFRILGLNARTATLKDVKKAYSQKLKVTRPEEDREGFMQLREAFETARRVAQNRRDPKPKAEAPEVEVAPEVAPDVAPDAPNEPDAPAKPEQTKSYDKWFAALEEWVGNKGDEPGATLAQLRDKAGQAGEAHDYGLALATLIYRDTAAEAEITNGTTWDLPDEARPAWWSDAMADALRNHSGILAFKPANHMDEQMFAHTKRLLLTDVVQGDAAEVWDDAHWASDGVQDDLRSPAPQPDVAPDTTPDPDPTRPKANPKPKRKSRPKPRLSPVEQAMQEIEKSADSIIGPPRHELWKDILDREELQPMDEFFEMDRRLRGFICGRTGLYEQLDKPKRPNWLNEDMVLMLDAHFGWSHHFGNNRFERPQYEWLHRVIEPHKPTVKPQTGFTAAYEVSTAKRGWLDRAALWIVKPTNLLITYVGYRVLQTLLRLV